MKFRNMVTDCSELNAKGVQTNSDQLINWWECSWFQLAAGKFPPIQYREVLFSL